MWRPPKLYSVIRWRTQRDTGLVHSRHVKSPECRQKLTRGEVGYVPHQICFRFTFDFRCCFFRCCCSLYAFGFTPNILYVLFSVKISFSFSFFFYLVQFRTLAVNLLSFLIQSTVGMEVLKPVSNVTTYIFCSVQTPVRSSRCDDRKWELLKVILTTICTEQPANPQYTHPDVTEPPKQRFHSAKEIYLKSLLTAEKRSRILQQRLSYCPVDNTLTRSFTKSTDHNKAWYYHHNKVTRPTTLSTLNLLTHWRSRGKKTFQR